MRCIVGDLHGCLDELRILEEALQDRFQEPVELIFTGDLVDRGPDSKGLIDYILEKSSIKGVLGNHDDLFLSAIALLRPDILPDYPLLFDVRKEYFLSQWQGMGGRETLHSYGIKKLPEDMEKIPPSHIEFLRSLPLLWEDEQVMVSHALITEEALKELRSKNISPKVRMTLLWNRDPPQRRIDPQQLHVSGHTVVPHPTLLSQGYLLIDTGCVFGYYLSAYCPQTRQIFSVKKGTKELRMKDWPP